MEEDKKLSYLTSFTHLTFELFSWSISESEKSLLHAQLHLIPSGTCQPQRPHGPLKQVYSGGWRLSFWYSSVLQQQHKTESPAISVTAWCQNWQTSYNEH